MFARRLQQLTPYTPGEQPKEKKYIKLNTNENPYPPCPGLNSLLHSIHIESFRLYPDPDAAELIEAAAENYRVRPDEVFVGNGSDEVLSFCFYALFDSAESASGPLLFPEHTYSFYPVYCDYYNIPYQTIPLKNDFTISLDDYLHGHSLEGQASGGIIFPNPNAPTGTYLTPQKIDRFLDKMPKNKAVVIDEAYIEFGGDSVTELIQTYPNLIVVRTLSKSRSLAGLRLGFAIAQPNVIDALKCVKNSFNSYPVNSFSQAAGVISFKDQAYFLETSKKIITVREQITHDLQQRGWFVLPSKSNFIFANKPGLNGEYIYQSLKAAGILVRYFNKPGIDDFVRITIGTKKEMEILIHTIDTIFC